MDFPREPAVQKGITSGTLGNFHMNPRPTINPRLNKFIGFRGGEQNKCRSSIYVRSALVITAVLSCNSSYFESFWKLFVENGLDKYYCSQGPLLRNVNLALRLNALFVGTLNRIS